MPVDWKDYPKNWRSVRELVMARAGNRCECVGECGIEHEHGRCAHLHNEVSLFTGKRQTLTTAHLCTRENCDDTEKTTPKCGNPAHLKAMCNGCHLRLDKHEHAANAKQTRTRKKDAERGLLIEMGS